MENTFATLSSNDQAKDRSSPVPQVEKLSLEIYEYFYKGTNKGPCQLLLLSVALAFLLFCQSLLKAQSAQDQTKSSNFAASLEGKLIVGYQGWFGYPDDFGGNKTWDHWSFKTPDKKNLIVDLLPATEDYNKEDLRPTGMTRPDGSNIFLFSSLVPNVVNKHFQWMADYGIDGASFQRFVADVAYPAGRERRDKVLSNVRSAAEANGRVFFITYDVSGESERTVYQDLEKDWLHLVRDLQITSSPNYLKHKGKAVLQIWGFGFNDRPGEPDTVKKLLLSLKNGDKDLPPLTLIGGVPTCWRTLIGDAKNDRRWSSVYACYDVISPWTVNRFGDELGAKLFVQFMVLPDMAEAKRLGIGYMPVIFPGFSWYNLMHCQNHPEKAILNRVPRKSGNFYWKQIHEMLAAHATMLYAAMFDEVNEGTALFKVETRQDRLPAGAHLLYPKLDGADVPTDWYLHLTGLANKFLREGSKSPEKPL